MTREQIEASRELTLIMAHVGVMVMAREAIPGVYAGRDDMDIACAIMHANYDLYRLLTHGLTLTDDPDTRASLRRMLDKVMAHAEQANQVIEALQFRDMQQAAVFESALVTIH